MTGNFVCNMCGKQFKSHKMLTQHNRDVHIEGDFPCTLCDKTFRTKMHLANHVFMAHYRVYDFEKTHGYLVSVRKMQTDIAAVKQRLLLEHLNSVHLR